MDKSVPITALIIGSGPDARYASTLPIERFDYVIVINNAWQTTPLWTHLVYPYDFPADRMPKQITSHQTLIDEQAFVPAQNKFGGFVYAGGTMAYTTAYWCLDALRPQHIAPIWAVICITQKQGIPIFMVQAGQTLCVKIFLLPH